ADLDMIDAVIFMHSTIGLSFEEAIRMASLYPAQALGIDDSHGHLAPGAVASFVHLGDDHAVRATWIGGAHVYPRPIKGILVAISVMASRVRYRAYWSPSLS